MFENELLDSACEKRGSDDPLKTCVYEPPMHLLSPLGLMKIGEPGRKGPHRLPSTCETHAVGKQRRCEPAADMAPPVGELLGLIQDCQSLSRVVRPEPPWLQPPRPDPYRERYAPGARSE